ncbi:MULTISPECIES: hypothetical protein [unclassified Modestobacter]|uniref:hypothetical protein n=1 Tax=unclassified Modestobacter TaxID=2643866 RepID=UPI0022AA9BE8|nr:MULTISPECIES: hypothetical protein [unclassified Modestobacter]MCZ2824266.1 hypothetical protein [Modestobacter sp. VKM Ac-2981]MCZ2854206.1 hypothetical protein [Modestobacter sp. VKM Ac-2982]
MPRPTRRPDPLRGRVFRGTTAVRSGLLTRDDLRSCAWVRLFPDVYADAALDVTHTVRAQAVGRLLLPHGVVSGVSAAVLWGLADLAGPADDVEMTVAPGAPRGAAPGVVVHRRTVPGERVRPVGGVPRPPRRRRRWSSPGGSPSMTASSCWTGSSQRGPPRSPPCG